MLQKYEVTLFQQSKPTGFIGKYFETKKKTEPASSMTRTRPWLSPPVTKDKVHGTPNTHVPYGMVGMGSNFKQFYPIICYSMASAIEFVSVFLFLYFDHRSCTADSKEKHV